VKGELMETFNSKKLIYIIVLAVLIIIGLAILLTLKPWVKTKNVPSTKISDIHALAPVLSTDSQNIDYYDLTNLNLYQYNLKNQVKTPLSKNMSDQPLDLNWSPDRSSVIIKIQYDKAKFESSGSIFANPSLADGDTTLWDYNLATQKLTLLDPNIFTIADSAVLNPIWTADSKKIIYYSIPDNGSPTLNIANPDGSSAQVLGVGPAADKFFSILAYDSANKILYYDSYSTETNLYNIYKFNLTTQQNDQLFTGEQTATPINDQQIVISDNTNSYIYNLTTQAQKKLPVLAQDQKTALSVDGTKLIVVVNNQDYEQFYLVKIADQSIVKSVYDKSQVGSSYAGLNLDKNNNLFFTNNYQLYEIKN
jgi:hypothetical protein